MKHFFKAALLGAAFTLCVFLPTGSSQAANGYHWVLDEEYARVQYVNDATGDPVTSQFMDITGYTYYFDKNGYAATGWTKIDGMYYYFYSDGSMAKKVWINNRYLTKNGQMAVNQYVGTGRNRRYVDKNGVYVPNYKKSRKAKFIRTKKGTRYRNLDGTYSRQTWQCINGHWYYFYSSGYMAKNRRLGYFYVDKRGRMVTNKWVKIGNYRYHYDRTGRQDKRVRIRKTSSKKTSSSKVTVIN
ncbi:MAG TPA: hypothetical protein IAB26_15845 [Candidatus Limivivens merdigallinarum]|uniref:Uncharacterized protein n=1 Tax=Candidatus Limivivens merdigallinarum TaxID=2840859 RepID=A0A9D1A0G3_9FIRM|nr:hypothetical protein [Candidatus Limivivens merdigallinarum]